MAQFDIIEHSFPDGTLLLTLDNPDQQSYNVICEFEMPREIEQVDESEDPPSHNWWVYADNFHLYVELSPSSSQTRDEIIVNGHPYNNLPGAPLRDLDVIIYEKNADGEKKKRKIRRRMTIVSSGGE